MVYQTTTGGLPDAQTASSYHEDIGSPDFAVTADPTNAIQDASAWDGKRIPAKCVVSPEMEMLTCYTGDDDTPGFDAIAAHHAAR